MERRLSILVVVVDDGVVPLTLFVQPNSVPYSRIQLYTTTTIRTSERDFDHSSLDRNHYEVCCCCLHVVVVWMSRKIVGPIFLVFRVGGFDWT